MQRLTWRSWWAVIVALVVAFIGLTALTTTAWTAAVDRGVLEILRSGTVDLGDAGPSWPMEFMRDLTSLAGVGIVVVAAVLIVVYQWLGGAWRASIVTIVLIGGTQMSVSLLKDFIARPRPDLVERGAQVFTHSYPSGHASMAAAIGLTLTWVAVSRHAEFAQRMYCWVVGIGVVGVIGFTRMYLGVHWFSDVVAGWIVGSTWAILCLILARRLRCCGTKLTPPTGLVSPGSAPEAPRKRQKPEDSIRALQ